VPGSSARGIFLSYRREDAAPYARLLQLQLRERIPDARVFMDLDSIEPGLDFAEVIREAVGSCAVLIALIGRQWATLADEEGQRRLDNPDDLVRFEVQTALERGVRVIPVLVDGARPPQRQQLPSELSKLARLNALELSYGRYEYDADRLLRIIQQVLDEVLGTGMVPLSPPVADADVRPDENDLDQAAQKEAGVAQGDRARATRVLTDAVRIARSISDKDLRASALVRVARVLAATDPDRAARLIADAERLALAIAPTVLPGFQLVDPLHDVPEVLAATDPDRAERLAQSVGNEAVRARVFVTVAAVVAATDPSRAERIARSITGEDRELYALTEAARALAATDPDRAARLIADAERFARARTEESPKVHGLLYVAEVLAAIDPDGATRVIADAERLARSRTGFGKTISLSYVARALATIDPDRAERIARSLPDSHPKGDALLIIAEALAATDPDRAERIARPISASHGNKTLLIIAEALAAKDPDRAERMARSITGEPLNADALADVARALAARDPDRAARLIGDAERMVLSFTYKPDKAATLVRVARALAVLDPDRAERIAMSIDRRFSRVEALVAIAETWSQT
jgi:hypothetical protein